MTTEIKKKKPNFYSFKVEVDQVCTNLLNEHNMTKKEQVMVAGIQYQGRRRSVISARQATQIGRLSKQYQYGGKYVQHGWWDK